MNTEFEIVFSHIDHDDIREKIKQLGGKCIQEKTLMKRVVFTNPLIPKGSFLRVRDEGNKKTCTYKEILHGVHNINAVREIETDISDMTAMVSILRSVGLQQKAYQESWRETWRINNEVDIMLDEWPGIKPFIEIESTTEEVVKKYVDILGFIYSEGIFGCVDQVYLKELGLEPDILNNLAEITFEQPPRVI